MLTSPRVSLAKSRAHCEEEKKREEEEASNRVSPPLQDVEMQDPPHDEGAAQVVVEAREVPARALPAKEEAEEDESLGGHLVEAPKVTHEWVEVSLVPRSLCS